MSSQFQYETNMMSGCGKKGSGKISQRPAFSRKSLEHDDTLIRSEDHLGEFKVPI